MERKDYEYDEISKFESASLSVMYMIVHHVFRPGVICE